MSDSYISRDHGLDDLLQQAVELTADMNGGQDMPRVERNLRQIMEVGEQLWTKTARSGLTTADASTDVRASILLGSKGIDLPRMSQKLDALSSVKTTEPLDPIHQTDIEGFLRNERENTILSVIEESNKTAFRRAEKLHWQSLENEWEQEKQKILNALLVDKNNDTLDLKLENESMYKVSVNLQTASALDFVETAYIKQIKRYNENVIQGGIRNNLCKQFLEVASKIGDKNIEDLWTMVSCMCSIPLATGKSVVDSRNSSQVQNTFINQARQYLENKYIDYIKATISGNLKKAQLGGIPGTFHMIKSFLNVKLSSNSNGLEDGCVEGHPVWPVIYFCIRCGDLAAALQAAISAGAVLKEFASFLREFMNSKDRRLSPNSETKIKLEYRRSIRTCSDPFKRIVYCLIGCCDVNDFHSEIADKTDDFLWLCLCLIRNDANMENQSSLSIDSISNKNASTDRLTLDRLQNMLLEEYGESHFNAYQQPFLYFQVLFLTAQFEAAIDFLARIEHLRCHAVHVAIALHQLGLLSVPQSMQTSLLTTTENEISPMKRLNFSKLIMMYTRKFESTDPVEALHYFYFLRNIKGPSDENLFTQCVSQLVTDTREFDMLLGSIQDDSCRIPGAIDKFCNNVDEVVQVVALNCEKKGQFEDSIKLYDLAKKCDKVLEIMSKLLSQVVPNPPTPYSKRDRLHSLAVNIAERYRNHGHNASREKAGTFFLLLDLCTFFDYYYRKNLQEALNVIQRIKIVPFEPEEVEERADNFRHLSDEIRRNLPDILLGVMNILYSNYCDAKNLQNAKSASQNIFSEGSGNEKIVEYLRKQARSLITFAGMIPYRMPGDTNASLVQLEVLMI